MALAAGSDPRPLKRRRVGAAEPPAYVASGQSHVACTQTIVSKPSRQPDALHLLPQPFCVDTQAACVCVRARMCTLPIKNKPLCSPRSLCVHARACKCTQQSTRYPLTAPHPYGARPAGDGLGRPGCRFSGLGSLGALTDALIGDVLAMAREAIALLPTAV
jgi:hypothetical protein